MGPRFGADLRNNERGDGRALLLSIGKLLRANIRHSPAIDQKGDKETKVGIPSLRLIRDHKFLELSRFGIVLSRGGASSRRLLRKYIVR